VQVIQNVGVYHDSDTTRWHFDQLSQHSYSFNSDDYFLNSTNLDNFLNSNHSLKFSSYHVPFPAETSWLDRFHKTYKVSAHTIIFLTELHNPTVEQIIGLDLPNVTIFVCGTLHHNFLNAKIYTFLDWFISTTDYYVNKPELLRNNLKPHTNKEKYFDILLGCARPHRDVVYNYIKNNNLDEKMIMTYYRYANRDLKNSDFIFEMEGVELDPDKIYTHSINTLKYWGRKNVALSQVIPFSVYNQTYYSIVAETNTSNDFNFYTEKVVKPILGGRLFIAIAGKDYLKNLRMYGFKTFEGIIDESYDSESDPHTRWELALEQLRLLCDMNPYIVYEKAEEIVKHNQQLMLTHPWYYNVSLRLKSVLDYYLTSDHIIGD